MADVTVARRAHLTVGVGGADTVTLTETAGRDRARVRVESREPGVDVWVRFDGVTPTPGEDAAVVVGDGTSRVFDVDVPLGGPLVVAVGLAAGVGPADYTIEVV